MDLIDAQAALDEARAGRLNDAQVKWLAEACHGDPRGQAVPYEVAKWADLWPGDGGSITRGALLDMGAAPAIDIFTASYLFGMGERGYGRSRYDRIRAAAPELGETLERVREIGRCQGPVFAYAQLYGGPDYDHRRRPGTPPWSRIASYGPAFFTKFLYFTVPGALILDARLAARVARLTGNDHGYLRNGRPVAWTPYRYAVYLHWMNQAAADVAVSPDLLELTLFNLAVADLPPRTGTTTPAPTDPEDDGDAAD
ncbi:8-oxoguanine DNA glycosylase OGG fold protein [Paractinoplanes lichenicola]|uniref:Uncharacterized protein n=1 Tax=Paractinoplanes lichenicola TaxID=2802976 RepID=A0ABS1VN30_9ACTN|nr:hypothetical protein [Actinoplanes lichenicola]MBL7255615.1 hypothetical protein [Actinoplanes lichenicola]